MVWYSMVYHGVIWYGIVYTSILCKPQQLSTFLLRVPHFTRYPFAIIVNVPYCSSRVLIIGGWLSILGSLFGSLLSYGT